MSEPDATIIGCDQLVALDGHILGKPGSLERAVDQLETLAGRTHELITALVVLRGERSFRHIDIAHLHMRVLTRPEIERYVRHDQPVDCAGVTSSSNEESCCSRGSSLRTTRRSRVCR